MVLKILGADILLFSRWGFGKMPLSGRALGIALSSGPFFGVIFVGGL